MSAPHGVPSFEELADLADGRLDPVRRAALGTALGQPGAPAGSVLGWITAFTEDARRLPLVAPPPLISQRLQRLMAVRDHSTRPLVQVTAHPVMDSRRVGRLAGVRSAQPDAASRYQLTFEAPSMAVVVLDVAEVEADHDEVVVLRGQVLPESATPPVFGATVLGPSGVVSTIQGDELGGFELRGVPLDASTLIVTNDELEIEMALELSDPGA